MPSTSTATSVPFTATPSAPTAPTVGADVAVSVAEAIVESGPDHGFDIHADALAVLVADARRRQLSTVLADVVSDPTAPTVARLRALGKLLRQWDRVDGPGPVRVTRSVEPPPSIAAHTPTVRTRTTAAA